MLKKIILSILVILLIAIITLVSSYSAPSFDNITFSLCSGYSAPSFDNITFSLAEDDSCVVDSCSYSSGAWEIDCNDNCTITSNVNLGGNDMVFSNTGTFWLSANITSYGNLNLSSGCSIVFDDNTQLVS